MTEASGSKITVEEYTVLLDNTDEWRRWLETRHERILALASVARTAHD